MELILITHIVFNTMYWTYDFSMHLIEKLLMRYFILSLKSGVYFILQDISIQTSHIPSA